jgi:signal transduction histidine kinase
MKGPRSLRARLIVGSFLWTLGLVVVTNVLTLGLVWHRVAHVSLMSVVSVALLVVGLTQIRGVLALFRQLHERLNAVRDGREARIGGEYPGELAPLVTDLNALLEQRSATVKRAIAKAGDLAHGLKTPLAVLGQEAERLGARGEREGAALVGQEVERMRRQIEYHLAHARAQAGGALPGTSSSVRESIDGLVRTLLRLYEAKGVRIDVSASPGLAVAVAREDLDEMLGNLLDNACKWARGEVRVHASREEARVWIAIDDDGPGIPADMRTRVLQRGVRADEAAPGSGLGLAIVADLVDVYRGALSIDSTPAGGTRATLTLPASRA